MSKGSVTQKNLQEQFVLFAKNGEAKSDGKTISLLQMDKWLIQARILDEKRVTSRDTGMHFNKFRLQRISYQDFVIFLEDLVLNKSLDLEEVKQKLLECGNPNSTSRLSFH